MKLLSDRKTTTGKHQDQGTKEENWQFLCQWLSEPATITHLDERHQELLFCHRLTGLAPKENRSRTGWEKIAEQYRQQTLANLQATGIYNKIVTVCNKQGIRILPLKGLSLAFRIHQHDLGRRQLSDLDMLIFPEDISHLAVIFESLGYRAKKPEMLKPDYLARKGKAEFVNANPVMPDLDIHTRYIAKKFLSSHSGIDMMDIFSRCHIVSDKNTTIDLLDPVDEWLYLAYHFGLHHSFAGLKWLDDLFVLSHHLSPDDWLQLHDRAKQAGLLTVLESNVRLLSKVYGRSNQPWSGLPHRSLNSASEVWVSDALTPAKLTIRQLELVDKGVVQLLRSFFWEFLFIDSGSARRKALIDLLFLDKSMLETVIGPLSKMQYWFLLPFATTISVLSLFFFSLKTLGKISISRTNTNTCKLLGAIFFQRG